MDVDSNEPDSLWENVVRVSVYCTSAQALKIRVCSGVNKVWIPDLVFQKFILTPVQAPKAQKRKSGSVELWGFVFFTSPPNFILIHARIKAKNRSQGFYSASLECKHLGSFHEPINNVCLLRNYYNCCHLPEASTVKLLWRTSVELP